MNVLVIDDSAFMRKAIRQMIESDPSLKVIDTAHNGVDALDKIIRLKPDLVTLDIEMPVMDGLTCLRQIQRLPEPRPAVLMCSSLTKQGSHEALAALSAGAADVIAKDASQFSLNITSIAADLVAKIKAIGSHRRRPLSAPRPIAAPPTTRLTRLNARDFDALLIGSSTGGPPALETLLTKLPADFPLPIVVAQHMPAMFTKSLAERLDQLCAVSVHHADTGMPIKPGSVFIGEGGRHVRILKSSAGRLALEISPNPTDALYKPSVNELIASGARQIGARCLAVVLTGMGDDGVIGAKELKAAGGTILAQSMESCTVYGMPKAVNEAGLTSASLPPEDLGKLLATLAPSAGSTAAPSAAPSSGLKPGQAA